MKKAKKKSQKNPINLEKKKKQTKYYMKLN